MNEAAQKLEFEQAARLRDQVLAVERVLERQKVVSLGARTKTLSHPPAPPRRVQVSDPGRQNVGAGDIFLDGSQGFQDSHLLGAFLKDYYARAAVLPLIICPYRHRSRN